MPAIYMGAPYNGQVFNRSTTVTISASIDKNGLTNGYSVYGIQFFIDGVNLAIAPVTSDWKGTTTFTFHYEGTYEIYGRLVNKSTGAYLGYQTGIVTITIKAMRPSNWSWTSNVTRGATIPNWKSGGVHYCKPLTAKEWNGFCDRIAEFMGYKGLRFVNGSSISDLYVTSNTRMYPKQVEAAAEIISVMEPSIPVPSMPSTGSRITAAYINGLKNSLNSIT